MQKFKLSYDDYNITKSIIDDIIENYQEYGYDEKPDEYTVNSNINWNTLKNTRKSEQHYLLLGMLKSLNMKSKSNAETKKSTLYVKNF